MPHSIWLRLKYLTHHRLPRSSFVFPHDVFPSASLVSSLFGSLLEEDLMQFDIAQCRRCHGGALLTPGTATHAPMLLDLDERATTRLWHKAPDEDGCEKGDACIECKQIGHTQQRLHVGVDLQHDEGQDHAEEDGNAGGTAAHALRKHLGDHDEGQRQHAHCGEDNVGDNAQDGQPRPGAHGVGPPATGGEYQHAATHAGGREDARRLAAPLLEDVAHEEGGNDASHAQHDSNQHRINAYSRSLGDLHGIDDNHDNAASLLEAKEADHH